MTLRSDAAWLVREDSRCSSAGLCTVARGDKAVRRQGRIPRLGPPSGPADVCEEQGRRQRWPSGLVTASLRPLFRGRQTARWRARPHLGHLLQVPRVPKARKDSRNSVKAVTFVVKAH